jgi:hypothetical protein
LNGRVWILGFAGAIVIAGSIALYSRKPRHAFVGSGECQGVDACEKACRGGDLCACGAIGALDLHGSGVARDARLGLSRLEQACEAGCSTACWALGSAYQGGAGVRGDTSRAKGYFDRVNSLSDKGCKSGDADQCFTIAGAYLSGHGVEADRGRALELYGRAADLYQPQCDKGGAHACARHAFLIDHGLGMDESKPKATTEYEKACELGDPESCEEAAKRYDGRTKELPRDDARSREMGHKACAGGRAIGCAIANEPTAFMDIVEAACARGSSFDCGSAAFALANGSHGVTRDLARAAPLAERMLELEQKACDDEDGSACAALARPYESGSAEGEPAGTVITRDAARASVLRQHACELGYQAACPQAAGSGNAPGMAPPGNPTRHEPAGAPNH